MLLGKRKVRFSLSLQINDLHHQSLIGHPVPGALMTFCEAINFRLLIETRERKLELVVEQG